MNNFVFCILYLIIRVYSDGASNIVNMSKQPLTQHQIQCGKELMVCNQQELEDQSRPIREKLVSIVIALSLSKGMLSGDSITQELCLGLIAQILREGVSEPVLFGFVAGLTYDLNNHRGCLPFAAITDFVRFMRTHCEKLGIGYGLGAPQMSYDQVVEKLCPLTELVKSFTVEAPFYQDPFELIETRPDNL